MLLEASWLVTVGFVILPLLVAAGFVMACELAGRRLGRAVTERRRRAVRLGAAVLVWLSVTALVAASGVLRWFKATPPPFAVFALAVIVVGIAVSCSPLGTLLVRGLPLWVLVGFQVFRFPLELVMHQAYVEGVMPAQMSYSGRNYDILSGITAGVLGCWLARGRVPRWVIVLWNFLGFALLVNIVAIAVVSTPLFRWFGEERLNVFVTYPPFVWLPGVLVMAALMGHILVWRRLTENPTVGPDNHVRLRACA
jgi:small-conductance mechanosensitive channel